jgi:hypothetical protein
MRLGMTGKGILIKGLFRYVYIRVYEDAPGDDR